MKLFFEQRLFSWFDSYDIYNESGETLYVVKGQLAWGHCLKIFDARGSALGKVKERILTLPPKFEMYLGEQYIGSISNEFSFFRSKYNIDCRGWSVDGNFFGWNYTVTNHAGMIVAKISKELFNLRDTYVIDVANPQDTLCVLMLVLAIDANKCSKH